MEYTENYFTQLNRFLEKIDKEAVKPLLVSAQELMSCYRCAMLETETKFRVLNEQFSLEYERNPIDSIQSRLKTPQSIREKLTRKGLPLTLESIEENIHDVAGVRVVCAFIDDIYMLSECLSSQDDVTVLEIKDYIKAPKDNGYRSLHMIIEIPIFLQKEKKKMKVEVQLRTIAMETWASLEHKLRYKKELDEQTLSYISSRLNDCAKLSAELDSEMQQIRDFLQNQT